MFQLGDIVMLTESRLLFNEINYIGREYGIVTEIEQDYFKSYDGKHRDRIIVLWLPINKKEAIAEIYLIKITK